MSMFNIFKSVENRFYIKMMPIYFSIFLVAFIFLTSCSTFEPCHNCDKSKNESVYVDNINLQKLYLLEFNEEINSKMDGRVKSIKSCTYPELRMNPDSTYTLSFVEITTATSDILAKEQVNYKLGRMTLSDFEKSRQEYSRKYLQEIPLNDTSEVKLYSTSSDVDIPPQLIYLSDARPCDCCPRDRTCIGKKTIFSKIEVRAMAGYRLGADDFIDYPGPVDVRYEKETLGFDIGGTDITLGLEAAFLWDITDWARKLFNIPQRHKLHLGPMIGLWPVDGSLFVPISLHPRYTFWYDETDRRNNECNAWYVFGDYGIPFDPTFELPVFCDNCGDNNLQAYFWGLGVGRDWWLSECMDFSIDVGFRMSQTPLPANKECEECTDEQNKYPFREIGQIFLRFGLTW